MTTETGPEGDALLSLVERIERLEQEIAELNGDKKEVYAEAKGNGFDKNAIKRLVKYRKQDPAERVEQDSLFELYLKAVEDAEAKRSAPRARARAREGALQPVVAVNAAAAQSAQMPDTSDGLEIPDILKRTAPPRPPLNS